MDSMTKCILKHHKKTMTVRKSAVEYEVEDGKDGYTARIIYAEDLTGKNKICNITLRDEDGDECILLPEKKFEEIIQTVFASLKRSWRS